MKKEEKRKKVGRKKERARVRKKTVLGKNLEKIVFPYTVLSSLCPMRKSMYVYICRKLLDGWVLSLFLQ